MVGQAFNPGHVNFAFPNPSCSSVTQIPGIAGNFVRSESSQNYLNMQNSGNPYGINQQGLSGQNHFGQPMQQDQYVYNQQQNSCPQNLQSVPQNPCLCAPGMGQPQMIPCGNFLPQNILDQIRNCVGTAAPIFILPQLPQVQQNPQPQVPTNMMGFASNYPPLPPQSFHDQFSSHNRSQSERNSTVCNCCRRNNSVQSKNAGSSATEENEGHRCCPGSDDTVCTRANCPASINLQALASQLLSLQGVIPCTATRLVLRKVPGSNVTTSVEEIMDRAQKSIASLNKEQLINEARNALQVNGLINIHMVSNPPQNIVPILTMLQLKVNGLKAMVENLVNRSVSECQSVGVDANTTLDPMILGIKSDAELREVLAILRQKECEERVNVSYAPYHSQRVVAESRLANFQNKINQVEAEIERRRTAAMPWANSGQFNQGFSPPQNKDPGRTCFESPNPFMVQVRSPRRLNLRPNVGGPESTYPTAEEQEASAVTKLGNEEEKGASEPSVSGKEEVDVKKKLKIHIDDKGELSVKKQSLEGLDVGQFVELSPDVVIVIDKGEESKGREKRVKILKKGKKKEKKKSEESIPSDYSTCDSESSVSVTGEEDEDQRLRDEKTKSKGHKNVFRRKKKTPKSEEAAEESVTRDKTDPEAPSIKKEKDVDVVMLSELLQDRFVFHDHKDTRGSDSVSLLEDGLEPVVLEADGDDLLCLQHRRCDDHGRLGIIREHPVNDNFETIYSKKFQTGSNRQTVLMTRDADSNSVNGSRSDLPEEKEEKRKEKFGAKTSGLTLLEQAHDETVFDGTRSSVIVAGGSVKQKSCKHGKENVMLVDRSTGTCSTMGKRNRDNNSKNVGGSISSMEKEHRKRFSYRFK